MTEKKQELAKVTPNEYFLDLVNKQAELERTPLTEKETNYALAIITNASKKLKGDGIKWNDVDVQGCQFVQQIKRFARLGMTIEEGDIYIDVRNNKKSAKKDINIRKQYQGIEKEIMRFCTKKVVRFYQDIICEGDDFQMETDFATGLQKVVKHEKNYDIDRNDLKNIVGAYKIAYVEENGALNQYVAFVDKKRIMRGYNASPSNEKTVWKLDTRIMVLKTATWVLYNNVLKPYMQVPTDLLDDWKETQDKMEWEDDKPQEVEEEKANINPSEINIDDIEVADIE